MAENISFPHFRFWLVSAIGPGLQIIFQYWQDRERQSCL